MKLLLTLLASGTLLMACSEEPPPRTVTEFVDNPNLLEAAMVRCSQDRSGTRYDEECVNAREAVKRIEAKEDAARRAELEKQSESKRRALRRTQEAAAAARRRAAEAERQRREEEYLAQFGVPMPAESDDTDDDGLQGNTPTAVLPDPDSDSATAVADDAADGGIADEGNDAVQDLNDVREELKRRNDDGSSPEQ